MRHDALNDHAEIEADACSSLALMEGTAMAVAEEVAKAGITLVSAPMVDQYTQVYISVNGIAQLQSPCSKTPLGSFA